jgi:Flp pilus assembly protein TadG
VVAAVGAAIDYSRANSVKWDLQAALDSTALMLSKEATTDTATQLQANALKYFEANYNRPGTTIGTISVNYMTTGGTQLVVSGSVVVPNDFMQVLGHDSTTIKSSSTVKWGMTRLRVALVLDNTGSMQQANKLNSLKSATKSLLSQLSAVATVNGDVYVSIIPFVKDVNVGSSNYKQPWLDWTDFDETSGYCTINKDSNKTKSKCLSQKGKWIVTDHSMWNGCVTDRGDSSQPDPGNYDTNVIAPTTAIPATLFSPDQDSVCPTAVMLLSYDWSAMNSVVSNMAANGTTNQAIGLAHGWMSLVGGGPYPSPSPMDSGYTYSQIIILLTDGLNTEDRWYSSQGLIDARQELTCDNIKNAGITLYTIQVNTGKDPVSTLLQSCASSSDKFYYLTSASQIASTFQDIGTKLSKLRIAN